MRLTIKTSSGELIVVSVDEKSDPMCIFHGIFGFAMDPLQTKVLFNEKVLNPFQSCADQGVYDGAVISLISNTEVQYKTDARPLIRNTSFVSSYQSNIQGTLPLIRNFSEKTVNFKINIPPTQPITRASSEVVRKRVINDIAPHLKEGSRSSPFFKLVLNPIPNEENYVDEEKSDDEYSDYSSSESSDTEEKINDVMREALRLNDLNFNKLEMDRDTGRLFQQMASGEVDSAPVYDDLIYTEEEDNDVPKTIRKDPLPLIWETSPDDNTYQEFCQSGLNPEVHSIEEAGEYARGYICGHWKW